MDAEEIVKKVNVVEAELSSLKADFQAGLIRQDVMSESLENLHKVIGSLHSAIILTRKDLSTHAGMEDKRLSSLEDRLDRINGSVDIQTTLLGDFMIEMAEPISTYKTAKYGMTFLRFVAQTMTWLVPFIAGIGALYIYLQTSVIS